MKTDLEQLSPQNLPAASLLCMQVKRMDKSGSTPIVSRLVCQTLKEKLSGFDKAGFFGFLRAEFQSIWPRRMLYIQCEKWLESYVLILHLMSHLSGESSLRKAFSSLVGYVSQSFIKGLKFFFQANDGQHNSSKTCKYLGDRKISSTIWSYGRGLGKAVWLVWN